MYCVSSFKTWRLEVDEMDWGTSWWHTENHKWPVLPSRSNYFVIQVWRKVNHKVVTWGFSAKVLFYNFCTFCFFGPIQNLFCAAVTKKLGTTFLNSHEKGLLVNHWTSSQQTAFSAHVCGSLRTHVSLLTLIDQTHFFLINFQKIAKCVSNIKKRITDI